MGQYRKKPVVIEAMQFTDNDSATAIWRWAGDASVVVAANCLSMDIVTLEGTMTASRGDWIIRGVKGEFYPCKPDIFAATYEEVDAGTGMEPALPPADTEYAFNMDITGALAFMRDGHKVRRAGWNGKGMWIVLMPELDLPPYSDQTTNRKVNDRTAKHIGEDTPFHSNPYIAMWNARGEWQPGWMCSQEDLLANDWQVVK